MSLSPFIIYIKRQKNVIAIIEMGERCLILRASLVVDDEDVEFNALLVVEEVLAAADVEVKLDDFDEAEAVVVVADARGETLVEDEESLLDKEVLSPLLCPSPPAATVESALMTSIFDFIPNEQ